MGDIEVAGFRIVDRVVGGARDAYIAHREGLPSSRYVLTALELTKETEATLSRDVASLACDCDAFLLVEDVVRCDHRVLLISEQHDAVDLPRLMEHLVANGATFGALCDLGLQLVRAMSALHASDDSNPSVHGAITPQQVLVTRDGELRIQGLGLGVLHDRALARDSLPGEVRCFLAPERFKCEPATRRTDVYGTALSLWWLLSRGSLPDDDGLDIDELSASAPSALWSALADALHVDPEARPDSCAALVEALCPLVDVEDRSEVIWSLEALHATAVVDEQLPVLASVRPDDEDSIPAYTSSIPPDDEDRPTIIQGVPVVEIASHRSNVVTYGEAGPSLGMIQSALSELVNTSSRRVRVRRRRRGGGRTKLGGFVPESVREMAVESARPTPEAPAESDEPRPTKPPAHATPVDVSRPEASPFPRREALSAFAGALAVAILWLASAGVPADEAPAVLPASTARAAAPTPAEPVEPIEPAAPVASAASAASAEHGHAATAASEGQVRPAGQPDQAPAPPDPKALDHDHGYLVVSSTAHDARVYVKGAAMGAPGEPLAVRCGPTWVRLGTERAGVWLSEGRPVAVPCRGTATLVLNE